MPKACRPGLGQGGRTWARGAPGRTGPRSATAPRAAQPPAAEPRTTARGLRAVLIHAVEGRSTGAKTWWHRSIARGLQELHEARIAVGRRREVVCQQGG